MKIDGILIACVIVWVFAFAASLAVIGLGVWGFIELVNWITTK